MLGIVDMDVDKKNEQTFGRRRLARLILFFIFLVFIQLFFLVVDGIEPGFVWEYGGRLLLPGQRVSKFALFDAGCCLCDRLG